MASGISGRTLPWSTRSADENTSAFRSVSSTSDRLQAMSMSPNGDRARLGELVVVGLRRRRVGHHLGLEVDEVDPRDRPVGPPSVTSSSSSTPSCRTSLRHLKMVGPLS